MKRLLQSIVTIFLVVSIVFLFLRLMPEASYFDSNTWDKMSDQVKVNALRQLGLRDANGDKIHPFVQLFNFYHRLFTEFSFGESTRVFKGMPVTQIIADRAPFSIAFGTISTFFSLMLGYTIGLFMGRSRGKAFDKFFMAYIVFFAAVPAIVYQFLMQFYITLWTGWPMIFKQADFRSWFTPVIISALTGLTGTALWLRRYTVDQMNSDYVKLAYAKGLPGRKIMYKHVLRNSFVPMAYNLPYAFIMTIGGSVLIENLFAIPGMGNLLVKAAIQKDNNLVQVIVFLYTTLSILSVFLGDLLAVAVDPRIRLTSSGGAR